MSNENNRENKVIGQPENLSEKCENRSENTRKTCEEAHPMKGTSPKRNVDNPGVAIRNMENESLNSLLVYDSDSSSSSSEMIKLNLNWQVRKSSEESSSSSSSSSESESSTEEEEEIVELTPEQNKGAIRKSKERKQEGELSVEQLPPVPDLSKLDISVEDENFVHMGNVLGIVDKLVTVQAIPNTPAYDLDTLLFLDNGRRPLGFVFDVLGQVTSPIYAIRFNSVEDIKNLKVEVGTKIYSAPTSKHTQYVFLQQLLKMKGSDASWFGDNEVPSEFADYSDDESECHRRFGNKKLHPHVKRTHSGDNHKKFETTMNRKNILNTKFSKYMDSYKQARLNKGAKRGPQIAGAAVPAFDPSVPPPNVPPAGFYQLPPEYAGMVYDPGSGENNNPGFFTNNFVANLSQANAGGGGFFPGHPGPSHQ